jgi:hypothetical protein
MSKEILNPSDRIREILADWLAQRLSVADFSALSIELTAIAAGASDRQLFKLFSLLPRQVGKADLALSPADAVIAATLCPGWNPCEWSVDQAARALLLLSLPQTDTDQVKARFEQLFTTAGLQELIALHQTLPLLPYPDRYRFWADEGIRSHMTGVFNAIALNNPYPATHFDAAAWNQLILKTIFIDSPLDPIYGLDDRANPALAGMLIDYVHERWAAHRRVTPEIWRLIGPFITPAMLPDLAKALAMDDGIQQAAIVLACQCSDLPAAQALVQGRSTTLTWRAIGQRRQEQLMAIGAV